MSEVIAEVNLTDDKSETRLPQGYDSFDHLEIVKGKNEEYINGVLILGEGDARTERRVKLPALDHAWGHNPEDRQKYLENPEIWHMNEKITWLTTKVDELNDKVEDLEKRLKEALSKNEDLERENQRLNKLLSETKGQSADGEPIRISDPAAIKQEEIGEDTEEARNKRPEPQKVIKKTETREDTGAHEVDSRHVPVMENLKAFETTETKDTVVETETPEVES